ncbi:MAG: hypothetical protein ACE14T_06065 [Syntrophales bacterium]
MGRPLILIVIALLLVAAATAHASDAKYPPARQGKISEGPGYSADYYQPLPCGKTREEVAWDLFMYGLQNIPALKARIKDYSDLLDAYRQALRTVKGM